MNPSRLPLPGVRLVAALALATQVAFAQNAPDASRPADRSREDATLVLSPFIVNSDEDSGYAATDSLAGTRLRTSLKDIAASVSVVTKEFMSDLGATGTADLLLYTTGTEVVGVGGNFSGSSADAQFQNFEAQRETANPNTRVRGLAAADSTRNFFTSPYIPLDSYNTQSVTINRGANAILFGFGSPAGIIENTLETPSFRNKGQLQLKVDNYGGTRESLDINHVLIDKKLAFRVDVLNDHKQYEQEQSYRAQRRFYGALLFQPTRTTTFRANAESGKIRQRLPRVDPPIDSMTTWWDFGRPSRTNIFYGAALLAYQRANNLDGLEGNWAQNPGFIYDNSNSTTPSDAYVAFATAPGGISYRKLGPRSSKEIAQFVTFNPVAGFLVPEQVLDRSIFDYRKFSIDGPNNGNTLSFDTVNLSAEQLFFQGNAGIELVYDHQQSVSTVWRTLAGYRGNNLFIDPNTVTIDGRPNPHFGRPMVAASGSFDMEDNELETGRATAFIRHDFRRKFGWFGRLLGQQSVTGLYSEHYSDQYKVNGRNAAAQVGWVAGTGGSGIADRNISTVVYLGPSLANAATPANANLQGIQSVLQFPATQGIWVQNATTGYQWVLQNVPIYQFPDFAHLASSVTNSHASAKSSAAVWQGKWWDDTLVSTLGWRNDTVQSSLSPNTAVDPTTGAQFLTPRSRVPALPIDNSSLSYGLTLQVPAKWLKRLPGEPELRFYYNRSENFQLTGLRRDILGDNIAPQSGSTKEYGFGISALDNRMSLRVTHYETVQDNITDTRMTTSLNRIAVLEDMISDNIPRAYLDSLGYVGPDNPAISELYKRYVDNFNFKIGSTVQPDGTRSTTFTTPPGTSEITNSLSKGLEIEATYNPTKNWRIHFNVAKQQAMQGDTSAVFDAVLADRLAQWQKQGLWTAAASPVWTVQSYAETNLINPLNTAKLSKGQFTSELVKWRVNFVTNYTFANSSRLKGWAIGGAVRWQDRVSIGYPVIRDPVLGLITDVKHPFYGPTQISYDPWLSYQRKIAHNKIVWKMQLNIRNLLDDNLMIPVKANPVAVDDLVNFTLPVYRIGAGRTWELTSTFSF
jgi:outer membrane receptor protein involved in Fe transport